MDTRSYIYSQYVSTHKGKVPITALTYARFSYWYMPLLTSIPPESPILEIGCGNGSFLCYLTSQGFTNLEGIDISDEQIQSSVCDSVRLHKEDVFNFLTTTNTSYRVIFAIDFIEHFTKEELLRLIPLLYQNLAVGGLLILQTPNGQGLFSGQVVYGDLSHQTIFAEDSLRQLLRLCNFREYQFYGTPPPPIGIEGKINSFLWKMVVAGVRFIRQVEARNTSRIYTENIIAVAVKN